MKTDIFGPTPVIAAVNVYGIEALEAAVDMANAVYDLADDVYFDDKEVNFDDLGDLVIGGPKLISASQKAISKAGQLDEEVLDLSEAEKARLRAKAGERVKDPSYLKILAGALEIIDGVAEKFKPSNPVD